MSEFGGYPVDMTILASDDTFLDAIGAGGRGDGNCDGDPVLLALGTFRAELDYECASLAPFVAPKRALRSRRGRGALAAAIGVGLALSGTGVAAAASGPGAPLYGLHEVFARLVPGPDHPARTKATTVHDPAPRQPIPEPILSPGPTRSSTRIPASIRVSHQPLTAPRPGNPANRQTASNQTGWDQSQWDQPGTDQAGTGQAGSNQGSPTRDRGQHGSPGGDAATGAFNGGHGGRQTGGPNGPSGRAGDAGGGPSGAGGR